MYYTYLLKKLLLIYVCICVSYTYSYMYLRCQLEKTLKQSNKSENFYCMEKPSYFWEKLLFPEVVTLSISNSSLYSILDYKYLSSNIKL